MKLILVYEIVKLHNLKFCKKKLDIIHKKISKKPNYPSKSPKYPRQKTPARQDEPLWVPAAPALALAGVVQDPAAARARLLRPLRPARARRAHEERRVAGRRHGGRPGKALSGNGIGQKPLQICSAYGII